MSMVNAILATVALTANGLLLIMLGLKYRQVSQLILTLSSLCTSCLAMRNVTMVQIYGLLSVLSQESIDEMEREIERAAEEHRRFRVRFLF